MQGTSVLGTAKEVRVTQRVTLIYTVMNRSHSRVMAQFLVSTFVKLATGVLIT